jgi:hypothetical protein
MDNSSGVDLLKRLGKSFVESQNNCRNVVIKEKLAT